MEPLPAHSKQLTGLLSDLQAVFDNSEWTVKVAITPPSQAVFVKGAWTTNTAIDHAKHYGEDIDSNEAEKRVQDVNTYTQIRQCSLLI